MDKLDSKYNSVTQDNCTDTAIIVKRIFPIYTLNIDNDFRKMFCLELICQMSKTTTEITKYSFLTDL